MKPPPMPTRPTMAVRIMGRAFRKAPPESSTSPPLIMIMAGFMANM